MLAVAAAVFCFFSESLALLLLLLWDRKGTHLSVMACHSSLSVWSDLADSEMEDVPLDDCCSSDEDGPVVEATPGAALFSAKARATIL